jgi:hypothetical protein
MYRVRRWNNDRDEMTEELVGVLVLDSIAMDGCVSVTWVPSEQAAIRTGSSLYCRRAPAAFGDSWCRHDDGR